MFALQGMLLVLVLRMIVSRFADIRTMLLDMAAGTVNMCLQDLDKQS